MGATLRAVSFFAAGLGGCAGEADSGAGVDSARGGDTAGGIDEFVCGLTWATDGLTFCLEGAAEGDRFLLGMVEESEGGWGGEDGLQGPSTRYGAASGTYDVNHDAIVSGARLLNVTTPDAVVANSTTLFTNTVNEAGHIGYLLWGAPGCVTQNDADGYYAAACP